MDPYGLSDLGSNPEQWVQGRHRVLEYQPNCASAQRPQIYVGPVQELAPLKSHRPGRVHVSGKKPKDSASAQALSRARFSDQRETPALSDFK
jgi:hypothetical protein